MIRFFLTLGATALLLVAVASSMLGNHGFNVLPSYFYQTLILLLFGTALIYVYLYRFGQKDLFVHVYLLTMAVKLLAYGAYNYFVISEDKTGAVANVVWFMLVYFIFTLLEIVFLYRKISG